MTCAGTPRFHRVCFVVEVLGGIEMVSMALAALDLVGHDGARPASPAVFLEGQRVLSYGELAYLAALRLGHAVAFLPASDEILSAYQPEFVVPAPGSGAGLAGLGYRPAAEPVAGATVFQRSSHPDAVICGTDDVVHLVGAGDAAVHEQQRRQLVELLGVPSRHVAFRPVGRLPRTVGGKVDYQSLAAVMDSHGGLVDGADELAAIVRPGI